MSDIKRVYLSKDQREKRSEFRSTLPVHPGSKNPRKVRPAIYDLKAKCPFIYDQTTIGSCTTNAICMDLVMLEPQTSKAEFLPSRLWLYYKERLSELKPKDAISDSGADAMDGLEILIKMGICPESAWPYNADNCNVAPPTECDALAQKHKVHRVGIVAGSHVTGDKLIAAIAESLLNGIPVLIGIEVFDSFESDQVAKTGAVPMPGPKEKDVGGHEVLIVGYNDITKRFICVNSWGQDWGWKGFFNIPYEYITNPDLCSEFICISKV